jgi:lysophospholipase L1-like esterase
MIQKKLQNIYEATVGVRNVAVGGWATVNGLDAFNERVLAEQADLMVLAYGMNDRGTPLDKYKEMIADMVCRFKKFNPDGEVVLVAPMLPNVETDWLKNQPLFAEKLYELEKEYSFVSVADMTQIHWGILSTGKRYRDMTGNNINHPNDFIARVYAQVILKTLLG